MVVVPIAILLSIPFSIQLTIRTYQLSLTGTDGKLMIRMSADKLKIPRSRIIAMQSVIKKYKGELSFTRSEGREEAYVILTV